MWIWLILKNISLLRILKWLTVLQHLLHVSQAYTKYMLSGCELIDTENISLPSQTMTFVGEWAKRTSHELHILSSRLYRQTSSYKNVLYTILDNLCWDVIIFYVIRKVVTFMFSKPERHWNWLIPKTWYQPAEPEYEVCWRVREANECLKSTINTDTYLYLYFRGKHYMMQNTLP
jgi:hypothetical protein